VSKKNFSDPPKNKGLPEGPPHFCILHFDFCIFFPAPVPWPFGALHLSRTLYKSAFFLQNKPNVKDAQIYISSFITMEYEKMDNWLIGKNKPNSNPIKAKTKPIQTQFPKRPK